MKRPEFSGLFILCKAITSYSTKTQNCTMKYLLPFFVLAILISCKKKYSDHEPVEGLQTISSKSQIDSEIADGVTMIFYHASWCSICQDQRPAVTQVAQDQTLNNVFFGEVEFDDHQDITDAYNVSGFPTIVVYKDGSEVERLAGGGNSTNAIKDKIIAHL